MESATSTFALPPTIPKNAPLAQGGRRGDKNERPEPECSVESARSISALPPTIPKEPLDAKAYIVDREPFDWRLPCLLPTVQGILGAAAAVPHAVCRLRPARGESSPCSLARRIPSTIYGFGIEPTQVCRNRDPTVAQPGIGCPTEKPDVPIASPLPRLAGSLPEGAR